MPENFKTITFPPENDEFFNDLRSEVLAYFQETGQSIYGNKWMSLKMAALFIVYIFHTSRVAYNNKSTSVCTVRVVQLNFKEPKESLESFGQGTTSCR